MLISRRYTVEGSDPFASAIFIKRTSRIVNPDGSVVFEMKDLLAPEAWSQVAVDILAQKYFRKAGVAGDARSALPKRACRNGCSASRPRAAIRARVRKPMPARSFAAWPAAGPTGAGRAATSPARPMPAPSSTKPATCWPTQMAAPNCPQWFNTGLHWAYGIEGPPQGHYFVDPQDRHR